MINILNAYSYCRENPELIENYEQAISDKTQIWQCHHRLETHNPDGSKRDVPLKKSTLIENHLYYERPACELIFLTKSAHQTMHKKGIRTHQIPWNKGKPCTKEVKEKISKALTGRKINFTEEHKRKIALARTGTHHSEEAKKKMKEAQRRRFNKTEVF